MPTSPNFDFGTGIGTILAIDPYSFQVGNGAYKEHIRETLANVKAQGFDLIRATVNQINFDRAPELGDFEDLNEHELLDEFFHAINDAGLRACILMTGIRTTGIGAPYYFAEGFDVAGREYAPFVNDPAADRHAIFAGLVAHHAETIAPGRWIWECGNEPNLVEFAHPYPNLEGYLYRLHKFGQKIKEATASITPGGAYVIGMTTSLAGVDNPEGLPEARRVDPAPIDWFRALAKHPAADVIDAVGPHPYTDYKFGPNGRGYGIIPGEESPFRSIRDLDAIRGILQNPIHRTSSTPIEIVPTEWGCSMTLVPPRPLPEEIPAYTATFGPTQRLINAGDFTGTRWRDGSTDRRFLLPEAGHAAGVGTGGFRDPMAGDGLGFYTRLLHGFEGAEISPDEDTWYGFAFEARCDANAINENGTGTRIWAGYNTSKTNFELTTEWKTYSGAFVPRDAYGPEVAFAIYSYLAGGEYQVREPRVFDLPGEDTYTQGARREAVQASLLYDVGRAAREAGCPAVFIHRWEDLVDTTPNPDVNNHYGLNRVDGSRKPGLSAVLEGWGADYDFLPSMIGPQLVAWYDVSNPATRFKTATGTATADRAAVDDFLGRLEDLSGNRLHLTPYGTGAHLPKLVAFNDLVKADFDGIDDILRTQSPAPPEKLELANAFIIGVWSVKASANEVGGVIGLWGESDSAQKLSLRNRANGTQLNVYSLSDSTYQDTNFAARRGADPVLSSFSNGGFISGGTFAFEGSMAFPEHKGTLALGAYLDGGMPTPLQLGELLILNGAPDLEMLGRIESYLTTKWKL